jgi:hypothetical protein
MGRLIAPSQATMDLADDDNGPRWLWSGESPGFRFYDFLPRPPDSSVADAGFSNALSERVTISLPICPEGMSEFAFARLLFAKYCSVRIVTLNDPGCPHTLYAAFADVRTRLKRSDSLRIPQALLLQLFPIDIYQPPSPVRNYPEHSGRR